MLTGKELFMDKGYIQIYTGDGKGKTTAAVGLAIRAAGAGLRTFMGQFIKTLEYGEIKIIKERFPEIDVELFGTDGCIINRKPNSDEIEAAQRGLEKSREAMISGNYDIIILDELSICIHFGMIETKQVLQLMDEKPEGVELVITGRYAPAELIERADLVTDMTEIKHYYTQGVLSREGIER